MGSLRGRMVKYEPMAKLGYVWCWPSSGLQGQPWAESPEEDSFARTSRRVTERYSETLEDLALEARRWSQKISPHAAEDASDAALVSVFHLPRREHVVHAHLPSRVVHMARQDRARLVLDVVDVAMRRIGARRGWDEEALDRPRQHALEHNLEFEMTGPWSSSATGDRRIRLVARVADDGWSDLCFEVADGASGPSLGFTQTVRSPLNNVQSFRDGVKAFRWADPVTVERPSGWSTYSGTSWPSVESFNIEDLRAWPAEREPAPHQSPMEIDVREETVSLR